MPVWVEKDSAVVTFREVDSSSAPLSERKMAFLVHLEVNKMIVTVYTTEEFAKENEP